MNENNARKLWVSLMLKIAAPVLDNLSANQLKQTLPLSVHSERSVFAPLEAFGRTACGIAPWLELEGLTGEEAEKQSEYRRKMLSCINNATNPNSPDYMNFDKETGYQSLVDAAFLSHALLRAPKQLAAKLSPDVKANLMRELKRTRDMMITHNNWLFFSAMVEAALYLLGGNCDMMRIDYAFKMFEKWYVGDGMYGDGEFFHFDYYNSFVIQPMMMDLLNFLGDKLPASEDWKNTLRVRSTRYSEILERLIAPDGSFPATGRSITYRFGAFQLLSQAVLQSFLPANITPAQVRCALTAVIEKVCSFNDMFDKKGWLRPGLCGYQPELAEGYITVGSLYLCMAVFLPLGLAVSAPFWSDKDEEWTSKKLWSGKSVPMDHAINT